GAGCETRPHRFCGHRVLKVSYRVRIHHFPYCMNSNLIFGVDLTGGVETPFWVSAFPRAFEDDNLCRPSDAQKRVPTHHDFYVLISTLGQCFIGTETQTYLNRRWRKTTLCTNPMPIIVKRSDVPPELTKGSTRPVTG